MTGFKTPISIKDVVEKIRKNEYLLPAFQREYVWKYTQVENLFDSLMKGYPIGSMLFWKVSEEAKNSYKFYQVLNYYIQNHHIHNEPFNTNQLHEFNAILDGQQRITSLYLGLCGTYAYHRYRARWDKSENNFPTRLLYLNISRTFPEDENDKTYNFSFKEKSLTKGADLYTDTNGDHWFLVGHILTIGDRDSTPDIDDFADKYDLKREEKKMLRMLSDRIFTVRPIDYYEVENSTPDEAVNIFVRINSGGTTLSFSNILMSMAIAGWQKKDARTEIHRLVDLVNNKGFNIDQDYVLKAFLYLYRNDVRFRIKSFNNQFIALIEDKWESIRDCIDELFELLRNFGLDRSSLTSYNATLPILYYLYHKNNYYNFSTISAQVENRELIRVWLMKSLLLRSFNSESRLNISHKAFTDDMSQTYIKDDITLFPHAEISTSIRQMRELTDDYIDNNLLSIHKDNSYAFAILSIIYSHLDYRNTFHKDHIHPYALCSEAGLDWNQYDTILNLQMLDANENMSKNCKPLTEWVEQETTDETRALFLKNHYIPDIDLDLSNFEEFIKQRRLLLHKRIRELFGYETGQIDINELDENENFSDEFDEE